MEEFADRDLLSLSKSELIVLIYKLIDENELLKVRIAEPEERLANKDNRDKGKKQYHLIKENLLKSNIIHADET